MKLDYSKAVFDPTIRVFPKGDPEWKRSAEDIAGFGLHLGRLKAVCGIVKHSRFNSLIAPLGKWMKIPNDIVKLAKFALGLDSFVQDKKKMELSFKGVKKKFAFLGKSIGFCSILKKLGIEVIPSSVAVKLPFVQKPLKFAIFCYSLFTYLSKEGVKSVYQIDLYKNIFKFGCGFLSIYQLIYAASKLAPHHSTALAVASFVFSFL